MLLLTDFRGQVMSRGESGHIGQKRSGEDRCYTHRHTDKYMHTDEYIRINTYR